MVNGLAAAGWATGARRRCPLVGALALSVAMIAGGCSSDEPSAVIRIDVVNRWTGFTEPNPLSSIVDLHQKRHPDAQVSLLPYSRVFNPAMGLYPVGLVQGSLGGNALGWGPTFQSIGMPAADWSPAFPPVVLDQVTYEGKLGGVPLALSRQAVAYWNLKVLGTLTLIKTIPETLAELDTWLREVSAAGYTHPLCIGGKDAWTTSWFVFNHVVPAVAGPDFSLAFWQGKASADNPKLLAAVDAVQALLPYVATDFADLDMSTGLSRLMVSESDKARQCLVTPLGNQGGPILAEGGVNVAGRDFVGTGWPGANLVTVFGGEAFVAPRGEANEGAVDWLIDTMASEEAQIAFSLATGSMPARKLAEVPASFDALTRKNIADLWNPAGTALPAYLWIARSTFPSDPLASVTKEFFQTKNPTAFLGFLSDNYAILK